MYSNQKNKKFVNIMTFCWEAQSYLLNVSYSKTMEFMELNQNQTEIEHGNLVDSCILTYIS